ncbi:MAG: cupin domain-containing protein [Rhodocyclaceae bacterium]|nr:cupin domain-containing protein [Rhodocyclaceae bacterium]MCA3075316.1 cupin domain-containing protein [Rhodocyclaceae bacterium]MCA3092187.1 cupin domain-containing protein [Rhodocyclaceae bacterium]MCA3095365.1 cupin domain-containing protein [Rhodocyclaceae bacterium]MCA3096595.1 cupin domain-containing protein [Rhodocyclaceae bacterium]
MSEAMTVALGTRIRDARERAGIGMRELARAVGVSASLLSQIERGNVKPSVDTLWAIVRELSISLDHLFDSREHGAAAHVEAPVPSPVMRAGAGKKIGLARGVEWQQLTAGSDPDADFVLVTYAVGASSSESGEMLRHHGREYGYLVSGRLGVAVGFDEYELGPGDAVSFESQRPHRLWAIGDQPAVAVWLVMRGAGLDAPRRRAARRVK